MADGGTARGCPASETEEAEKESGQMSAEWEKYE